MRLPQRTGIDTEAWLPWQGTPPYRLWISEDVLDAITRSHVASAAFVHVSHGCNPRALEFV